MRSIDYIIFLTFAGMGILIKYFKFYWLIAGYNTMPEKKKKNVDVKGLASFMGNIFFVIAIIHLGGSFLDNLGIPYIRTISIGLVALVVVYMLIGSQKYDKNKKGKKK